MLSWLSIVAREGRVLLTRDRYLLMRTAVERGYWVRSTEPKQQLLEVVKRFDLAGSMRPFTRCLECNTILEEASRESAIGAVAAQDKGKGRLSRLPELPARLLGGIAS